MEYFESVQCLVNKELTDCIPKGSLSFVACKILSRVGRSRCCNGTIHRSFLARTVNTSCARLTSNGSVKNQQTQQVLQQ